MDLIVATRNPGKLAELKAHFDQTGLSCRDLSAYPEAPAIVEDATTFAGNAIKKAVTTALALQAWCLADDSGLEVEALGQAPGVRSARYAGEQADDNANNRKLLQALDGKSDRRARFRCVLALSSPRGHAQIVDGVCNGRIATHPEGDSGFGYDPLFIPDGYDQTMAQLGPAIKRRISHRAHALRQAVERWHAILEQQPERWPIRSTISLNRSVRP